MKHRSDHLAGLAKRTDKASRDEGYLAIFLVTARLVEVGELGRGRRGSSLLPVTCSVDVAEGLDRVALAAELFVDPVEAFGSSLGPFCLGSL